MTCRSLPGILAVLWRRSFSFWVQVSFALGSWRRCDNWVETCTGKWAWALSAGSGHALFSTPAPTHGYTGAKTEAHLHHCPQKYVYICHLRKRLISLQASTVAPLRAWQYFIIRSTSTPTLDRTSTAGPGRRPPETALEPATRTTIRSTFGAPATTRREQTGLDLFANLPDGIEEIVENNSNWQTFQNF